jgi:hypothetical protein
MGSDLLSQFAIVLSSNSATDPLNAAYVPALFTGVADKQRTLRPWTAAAASPARRHSSRPKKKNASLESKARLALIELSQVGRLKSSPSVRR